MRLTMNGVFNSMYLVITRLDFTQVRRVRGRWGNAMGWRVPLEATILEKIWMIITSGAILRPKELM